MADPELNDIPVEREPFYLRSEAEARGLLHAITGFRVAGKPLGSDAGQLVRHGLD